MKLLNVLFLVATLLFTSEAKAFVSPIGISLFPPIELPPPDFTVTGVRVNLLWGNHHNVYGFDFGTLVNQTLQNVGGLQIAGGVNYNNGNATIIGLQASAISNVNLQHLSVIGLQVSGVNSNQGEASIYGIQAGLLNLSAHTKMVGLQVGLYNKANEVYGFQIGVVNSAGNLHGIQIGLLNFNDRGLFAIVPILNVGF